MSEHFVPVPLNPYIAVKTTDDDITLLKKTTKRVLFYKRITIYYIYRNKHFVSEHYFLFNKNVYVNSKQFTDSEEALEFFDKVTK